MYGGYQRHCTVIQDVALEMCTVDISGSVQLYRMLRWKCATYQAFILSKQLYVKSPIANRYVAMRILIFQDNVRNCIIAASHGDF